ncbi:hypothetical protein G3797_003767 [Salmonella enterica subsp. enterica serovar Virchow]|uniref:AfaD family invasin n=1 Tax=Salmonella enterica TaxID=28901 RepID=UPI0009AE8154|nr:hypothetical protein [Salmonella enterica]EEJ6908786.1 hypothetical protein [Salmonella enterica subsp. enterica serovar Stanleyville]EEK8568200.1 hypothetical protein [Salmonella enterica subsp. enterica serovar Virchow]EHF8028733.1 hypothetical protein [Salmonella enterica subsp. enterica serovar Virchow]
MTKLKVLRYSVCTLMSCSLFFVNCAYASDLMLSLSIKEDSLNKDTPNDYIIGKGFVKNYDSDIILVSTNAEKVIGTQSTYIFRGRNNPKNKIKIRLGGENWTTHKDGLGIIANTKLTNTFNLYYIGSDALIPDTYMVNLYAVEVYNK